MEEYLKRCFKDYFEISIFLGDKVCIRIPQTRILEWVAIPSFGGSSGPRDWIQSPRIAGRFFNVWAAREAPY